MKRILFNGTARLNTTGQKKNKENSKITNKNENKQKIKTCIAE